VAASGLKRRRARGVLERHAALHRNLFAVVMRALVRGTELRGEASFLRCESLA